MEKNTHSCGHLPTFLRGTWRGQRETGLNDSSRKLPPFLDSSLQPRTGTWCSTGAPSCCFPHTLRRFWSGCTWCDMSQYDPNHRPTLTLCIFWHEKKRVGNLQVAHARVVVEFACAVSKNGHILRPFGLSPKPCNVTYFKKFFPVSPYLSERTNKFLLHLSWRQVQLSWTSKQVLMLSPA